MTHTVYLAFYTRGGDLVRRIFAYSCPDEGIASRLAAALNERDKLIYSRYEVLPRRQKGN